jgi:hypothetical protein
MSKEVITVITAALKEIANVIDKPGATPGVRQAEEGRLTRVLTPLGLNSSVPGIVAEPNGLLTSTIVRTLGDRLFLAAGGARDQKGFEAMAQALDDVVTRGADNSRASFDLIDAAWQGIGQAPGEVGWGPGHAFRKR